MLRALVWVSQAINGAHPAPIATDRPDFTESALVVPEGRTQIESGVTWQRTGRGTRDFTAGETLLRLGVSRKFELRVGLPNYVWQRDGGGESSGFDDLYLGAKAQLGPAGGWDLAVIPAVVVPVGADGIRSEEPAQEVKFCWARQLGSDVGVSGMLYYSRPTESTPLSLRERVRARALGKVGEALDLWQNTVSLAIPVGERTALFVEYVVDFSHGAKPAHLLHSGVAYQPGADTQWDLHFGLGLTRSAPDFFVGAGYSVRL